MEISSYTRDVEVTQQEGNREFPWQLCSNPSDVTGQVLFLFGGCFFIFFTGNNTGQVLKTVTIPNWNS